MMHVSCDHACNHPIIYVLHAKRLCAKGGMQQKSRTTISSTVVAMSFMCDAYGGGIVITLMDSCISCWLYVML